jgi:hypothetical protein
MTETDVIEFKATFVNDLNKEIIAFANTNGGQSPFGYFVDEDRKLQIDPKTAPRKKRMRSVSSFSVEE